MGYSTESISFILAAGTLIWFVPLILYSLDTKPVGLHRVSWFLTLLLMSWPAYVAFLVYARLGDINHTS